MLYDTKCWVIKKQPVHKMSVVEMRMLRWISGIPEKMRFKMRKFA